MSEQAWYQCKACVGRVQCFERAAEYKVCACGSVIVWPWRRKKAA